MAAKTSSGDPGPDKKVVTTSSWTADTNNITSGFIISESTINAASIVAGQFEIAKEVVKCGLCGKDSDGGYLRIEETVFCGKCLKQAISQAWSQANLEAKRKKSLQDLTRCHECLRKILLEHAWNMGSDAEKLVLCDTCYLDFVDKSVQGRLEKVRGRNIIL